MANRTYRFPSLAHADKIGYVFYTDSMALWDSAYQSRQAVWDQAGQFETLGDGMCAHSLDWAIGTDRMADYFASFATFLLSLVTSGKVSEDDMGLLGMCWPSAPSHEAIRFALSLKYRADKRQWYNLDSRKVSSADSREHDKRWERVPEYADGSPESAYRLLCGAHTLFALERWIVLDAVYEYKRTVDNEYQGVPGQGEPLNLASTPEEANRLSRAIRAVRSILDALRKLRDARHTLDAYQRMPRNATEDENSAA